MRLPAVWITVCSDRIIRKLISLSSYHILVFLLAAPCLVFPFTCKSASKCKEQCSWYRWGKAEHLLVTAMKIPRCKKPVCVHIYVRFIKLWIGSPSTVWRKSVDAGFVTSGKFFSMHWKKIIELGLLVYGMAWSELGGASLLARAWL